MIAAQVYEKGPQTLADAISEVEKLQATQQLTATLIPSSTVNVMFHEEDCCFQCQDIRPYRHDIAQMYIALNVMNMDI